jgi:hypothetical protein
MTSYGHYALRDREILFRLPDGSWKVVRELDEAEAGRLARACQKLPEKRATYLLALLDPGRRTPGDPAERWAWEIVGETEG